MTTSPFHQAFEALIGHEGAYVDDPHDPGGETKYGISKRAYPGLVIRDITLAQAKAIYYRDYWQAVRGDEFPVDISMELFDAAVNHGPTQAIQLMQRALRVSDDGVIGPVTLAAARSVKPASFIARFNAQRLFLYTDLKTWLTHGKGWARRVAANLMRA